MFNFQKTEMFQYKGKKQTVSFRIDENANQLLELMKDFYNYYETYYSNKNLNKSEFINLVLASAVNSFQKEIYTISLNNEKENEFFYLFKKFLIEYLVKKNWEYQEAKKWVDNFLTNKNLIDILNVKNLSNHDSIIPTFGEYNTQNSYLYQIGFKILLLDKLPNIQNFIKNYSHKIEYPILMNNNSNFVIGTTGAGKTLYINNIYEQFINKGCGSLIVDGKGDQTVFESCYNLAVKNGRIDDFYYLNFNNQNNECFTMNIFMDYEVDEILEILKVLQNRKNIIFKNKFFDQDKFLYPMKGLLTVLKTLVQNDILFNIKKEKETILNFKIILEWLDDKNIFHLYQLLYNFIFINDDYPIEINNKKMIINELKDNNILFHLEQYLMGIQYNINNHNIHDNSLKYQTEVYIYWETISQKVFTQFPNVFDGQNYINIQNIINQNKILYILLPALKVDCYLLKTLGQIFLTIIEITIKNKKNNSFQTLPYKIFLDEIGAYYKKDFDNTVLLAEKCNISFELITQEINSIYHNNSSFNNLQNRDVISEQEFLRLKNCMKYIVILKLELFKKQYLQSILSPFISFKTLEEENKLMNYVSELKSGYFVLIDQYNNWIPVILNSSFNNKIMIPYIPEEKEIINNLINIKNLPFINFKQLKKEKCNFIDYKILFQNDIIKKEENQQNNLNKETNQFSFQKLYDFFNGHKNIEEKNISNTLYSIYPFIKNKKIESLQINDDQIVFNSEDYFIFYKRKINDNVQLSLRLSQSKVHLNQELFINIDDFYKNLLNTIKNELDKIYLIYIKSNVLNQDLMNKEIYQKDSYFYEILKRKEIYLKYDQDDLIDYFYIDNFKYNNKFLITENSQIIDVENLIDIQKINNNYSIKYNLSKTFYKNKNYEKKLLDINLLKEVYIKYSNFHQENLFQPSQYVISPIYILNKRKKNIKQFETNGFKEFILPVFNFHFINLEKNTNIQIDMLKQQSINELNKEYTNYEQLNNNLLKIKKIEDEQINYYKENKQLNLIKNNHFFEETFILGIWEYLTTITNITTTAIHGLKFVNPHLWFALISLNNKFYYHQGEEILSIYYSEKKEH